jgi:hypothetical protein
MVKYNGVKETAISPRNIQELDALEGRQTNNILPKEQYDLLQKFKNALSSDDEYITGFKGLQSLKCGDKIYYNFTGGDFGENLQVGMRSLSDLSNVDMLVNNQKEFDKYQLPVDEYLQKTTLLIDQTPPVMTDAMTSAQEDLKFAESLPELVKAKYTSDPNKTAISYSVTGRQEDTSSVMGRIRGDSMVPNPERIELIDKAQKRINSIEKLETELIELQESLIKVEEESKLSDLRKKVLRNRINSMLDDARASQYSPLVNKMNHFSALLETMENRAPRPNGWKVPSPLVQE